VFAEKGERVWLVNDRPLLPVYGPSAASLDEHSLANQTNLFILVSIPH
jgi:hypothetical protein